MSDLLKYCLKANPTEFHFVWIHKPRYAKSQNKFQIVGFTDLLKDSLYWVEKTSFGSEIDTQSLLGHNHPTHSVSHLLAAQLAVVFCILQCNIKGSP